MGNVRMVIIYTAVALILLAITAATIGVTTSNDNAEGYAAYLLLWPTFAYAAVAIAYTVEE